MPLLSRLTVLVLSLLLVTQAAWPMSECGPQAPEMSNQGMDGGHHGGTPDPASHRTSCMPAICVTMVACAPVALHEAAPAATLSADAAAPTRTLVSTVSPAGPNAPDPPPPRV